MVHYKNISEWFEAWGHPKPEHPLISVVKVDVARILRSSRHTSIIFHGYLLIRVLLFLELKIEIIVWLMLLMQVNYG